MSFYLLYFQFQEEAEKSALDRIQQALLDGKPARSVPLTDLEKDAVRHLCLLTMKPIIYVANVAESDVSAAEDNPHVKEVINLASGLQSGIVTVSAQVWIYFYSRSDRDLNLVEYIQSESEGHGG